MNVIDIVARLLATENLSVVRDNVETASFDLVHRVLTMPIFKGMTPTIEEMMVGHEVGHAKHTTWKLLEEANRYHEYLPMYFNVTEDVRIEKHMKREYPGLRKSMTAGYKELNGMDFFGVKNRNLQECNLIDKINLYYKVGHDCGVEFDDEEFDFVLRTEHTETERQALDLAKEIFEYQRKLGLPPPPKKAGNAGGKSKSGGNPGDSTEESGEGDSEGDGQAGEGDGEGSSCGAGESEKGKGAKKASEEGKSGKCGEEAESTTAGRKGTQFGSGVEANAKAKYLEAKTVGHFEKKLKDAADTKTKYSYHTIVPIYGNDPIVPFKKVLAETAFLDPNVTTMKAEIQEIKEDSKQAIAYMIKEFEMRKSAEVNKRITISKTGMLDTRKLYAYSLKDDVFRRNSVIPRGKNHGMVFLIDWSGSMQGTIDQVLRQTIDLASFCRRCQIPFSVFAFTTGYRMASASYVNGTERTKAQQGETKRRSVSANAMQVGDGNFHLLQFLSSEMTNKEFNTMCDRLLTRKITHHGRIAAGYTLGGTPLNEALIYMVKYLPEFRVKHQLEKLSFVTMTDGEGHGVHSFLDYHIVNGGTRVVNKHFIRDEKSKKDYPVADGGANAQTHAILQYIRDRAGVSSIGFHIMESMSDLGSAIESMHGAKTLTMNKRTEFAQAAKISIEQFGSYDLPSTSRDAMFIVRRGDLTLRKSKVEVNANSTTEQIAQSFGKNMKGRKANRLLLDKFIQTIA